MLRTEPGFETTVSRRRLLAGGVALAALGIAAPACSSPPPPPAVDELEAELASARRDSDLAKAAAVGAPQQIGIALTEVAAERGLHAQALKTEIARLAVNPTSTTATTPTTTNAAAPPPPLADVVRALKASADSAGQLATTSSGYRAGLLGSIAASCTASYTVALASEAS